MGLFSQFLRQKQSPPKQHSEFEAKFFVGKKLGSGAYGEVHEAIRKQDGSKFAVKIIAKSKLKEDDSVANEISILKLLKHPNITHLQVTNTHYYLVVELATGGELFDRILAKGSYTEVDAAKLVRQLLSALTYLHDEVGIVHRDLKPENLLFKDPSENSDLVVTDFGLSKSVGPDMLSTMCGSPSYIAPEILQGLGHGFPVDMWSTGVITYVLLCGYTPFWGGETNSQTVMYQSICKGQYEFDREFWDCVSADAKDFIAKLLLVNADKRMTAKEALAHPWMLTTSSMDLLPNVRKNFNPKATFKKAAVAIAGLRGFKSQTAL